MIVSNSTVLIFLSKIDKINLLKDIFKIVLIPEEVKKEVVDQGKKHNHIDAIHVERAIKQGWIKVIPVTVIEELNDLGIDKGEAEAISLAIKQKKNILLDQTHARLAAKLFGLKPRGTIYLLLRALKIRLISYDNYILSLQDLVDIGFRMNPEVYLEALRLGKVFK